MKQYLVTALKHQNLFLDLHLSKVALFERKQETAPQTVEFVKYGVDIFIYQIVSSPKSVKT